MSLARETDGDLEAGTEVDEEVEEANRVEEVNNRVEEVEGETEDFTSILLPVDSKERRVVLRRVSLIKKKSCSLLPPFAKVLQFLSSLILMTILSHRSV